MRFNSRALPRSTLSGFASPERPYPRARPYATPAFAEGDVSMIADESTRGRAGVWTAWMAALLLAACLARESECCARSDGARDLAKPPSLEFDARVDDGLRVSLELKLRGNAALFARAYKHAPRLVGVLAERAAGAGVKIRPGLWPDPG